jgi:hypothetical protein
MQSINGKNGSFVKLLNVAAKCSLETKNNLVMVLDTDGSIPSTVAVEISDEQLANAKYKFPLQTPT